MKVKVGVNFSTAMGASLKEVAQSYGVTSGTFLRMIFIHFRKYGAEWKVEWKKKEAE